MTACRDHGMAPPPQQMSFRDRAPTRGMAARVQFMFRFNCKKGLIVGSRD